MKHELHYIRSDYVHHEANHPRRGAVIHVWQNLEGTVSAHLSDDECESLGLEIPAPEDHGITLSRHAAGHLLLEIPEDENDG